MSLKVNNFKIKSGSCSPYARDSGDVLVEFYPAKACFPITHSNLGKMILLRESVSLGLAKAQLLDNWENMKKITDEKGNKKSQVQLNHKL